MFDKTPGYRAWFLPGPPELDDDEALRLALAWLVEQPGTPLLALHAKKMTANNLHLQAAERSGITVVAPPRMWVPGWKGGAVLAPWASRRVLDGIDDDLGAAVAAVCVIQGSATDHTEWRAARQARDLRQPAAAPAAGPDLDPVVVAAMTEAGQTINHNNALVQTEDKAYVVITLQRLVEAGHAYDVSDLCAWAAGNGFTAIEVKNLRDIAQRVLDGRRFQLRSSYGPGPDAVTRWRDEAAR